MKNQEKIAEFIGIMLGDGSIGIYKCKAKDKIKEHWRLKVTSDSRNKDYINYVANLIENVLEYKPKIYYKKKENAVDICIFKREIIRYALNNIQLKISPKWNNMEIPKKFAKGKLALWVLRGLFDTDGSVTIFNNNGKNYPRIEIRISPSPDQNQVIKILQENKFNFKIQKLEKGKIKIRISGKNELKEWFNRIGSSNKYYLERAKPFLSKKGL